MEQKSSEYTLVNDITGKPPEPRGPYFLEIQGEKFKVPHMPKKGCAKCYGRGYVGRDILTGMVIFCKKCYKL